MLKLRTMDNLELNNRTVLCRVDLNVPFKNGRVVDNTRIIKLIPTFEYLLSKNVKLVILSHFGRPKGEFNREFSLAPITNAISEAMSGRHINFALDCIGDDAINAINKLEYGQVLLLENLRFYKGEEENDPAFVEELAKLGDVYINDTFSCSHRAHASIVGLAEKLPSAAGLLLQSEVENLEKLLHQPKAPVAAIVGGSKISTKLGILNALLPKVDYLIIGGAMANSFLAAKSINVGKSLVEQDYIDVAKNVIKLAEENNCKIVLPRDVVLSERLEDGAKCLIADVDKIKDNFMILDVGPSTVMEITSILDSCQTVIWNGPLGAFEFKPFDNSSVFLARYVAKLSSMGKIISVAGGGDVVAALNQAGVFDSFSYISTAGGAFLEWLEDGDLPGLKALRG